MTLAIHPRAFLLLPLLLAGCDGNATDPRREPRPVPLPRELCRKVAEGLQALRARGALDYGDDGEAVIEQPVWFSMGGPGRDQLAQTLAYHAVCQLPGGATEQQVIIRNGGGMILMRRTVATGIDMRDILGDDGGEAIAK